MKLPRTFYDRNDVTLIAQELLGKKLVSNLKGQRIEGIVSEVEAYSGINDKACHASNGRRTARNEVMYGSPGYTYVYLCYGMHHMLNVVTNSVGKADAILVRAIEPIVGIEHIFERRHKNQLSPFLTSGPGNVGQSLGLDHSKHNGIDLCSDKLWLEEAYVIKKRDIVSTTRVGISYAEEDAFKPWRFYLRNSKWISKK